MHRAGSRVTLDIQIEKREFGPTIAELQPEWDALLERSSWPSIYSTFDYVYTTCGHYETDESIFFLIMRNGESRELLAIFPLNIWIHDYFKIDLRVITHALTTSFTEVDKPYPIIDSNHEKDCWTAFAHYVKQDFRQWDLIDFDSTISDTYLSGALDKLFPHPQFFFKVVSGTEYPIVRLDGAWETFWNEHRTVRRKTRKIEKEIGEQLRYEVTNEPADVERCLSEFAATEKLSWKSGQGITQESNQEFYQKLLPKLADKQQVYFGTMYDGDTVMSAVIAFVYGKQLYFALCAYNPEYAHLSAGSVNWTRMVECFHGKGLAEADFLSAGADYILPLADRVGKTQDITIYRIGFSTGFVALKYAVWKFGIARRRRRNRAKISSFEKQGLPFESKKVTAQHHLNIQVEKIYLGDRLLELAEEWDELLKRSSRPTIYSSFDYVYSSCKHFKTNETVAFLFFRNVSDGRLLAVYPISIWTDMIYRVPVRTIEHGITTAFTDVDKPYPIIDKDSEKICWKRFRNYFHKEYRNWDVILYDELFFGSHLNHGLRQLFKLPLFWTKLRPGPDSPMVRLDGDWKAFEAKHKNMRSKSRRLEKKIGDQFSYRVTGDPADVKKCLNEYIAIEQMGYKAGQGVSRKESIPFYHDLLPRLAERGELLFGMMYDGDTVISAEISYVYQDQVYFALGTYNPEYSKLSPGTVSTSRFIEYFHDKGFVEGDFLAGFAKYVNPWASRIEKTVSVTVRRVSLKTGYLAARHLATTAKIKLKRIYAGKPTKAHAAEKGEQDVQK